MYDLKRKNNTIYRVSQLTRPWSKFYSHTHHKMKKTRNQTGAYLFLIIDCVNHTGTLQNPKNQNTMLFHVLKLRGCWALSWLFTVTGVVIVEQYTMI